MIRHFQVPSLSSWNGPASVVHVVQTLEQLCVPASNLRLLPLIGHYAQREILPYDDALADLEPLEEPIDGSALKIRLGVNVRVDNRFARFVPLLMVGMPSAREAVPLLQDSSPKERLREWYGRQYQRLQAAPEEASNVETPVERLTRQLWEQYPELRESTIQQEETAARERLIIRQRQVISQAVEGSHTGTPLFRDDPSTPQLVQELAEILFTNAFLSIAAADLIGGFEVIFPFEPEGRPLPLTINAYSRIEDVVRWLRLYPHVQFSLDEANEQLEPSISRDDAAVQWLWTENDPAVQQLYGAIRQQYDAGRTTDDITPDEMLALVRRYLPEYVPCYPQQSSLNEGLNLSSLMLSRMIDWCQHDSFLTLDQEIQSQFLPEEWVVLEMLILLRRVVLDWLGLFRMAVRLLVNPSIRVEQEPFVASPCRLGTPTAQLGRTLVLGTIPSLHAPCLWVYVPRDHTEFSDEISAIENRLDCLRRLFVPVHVPVRLLWAVDWARLGQTTYLNWQVSQEGDEGFQPRARLSRRDGDLIEEYLIAGDIDDIDQLVEEEEISAGEWGSFAESESEQEAE